MLTAMTRTAPGCFATAALVSAVLLSGCDGKDVAISSEPVSPQPVVSAESSPAGAIVRHVEAEAAEKLLSGDTNIVVLDVRTPEEFSAGHLPGAINVDFRSPEFASGLDKLNRETTYLVHCASGRRSTAALEILRQRNFASIVHLDGGLNAWKAAQKPVVK
jgi:rhodanese-related sulfurtransferase